MQAFDLETEPINFHSPDVKQCIWLPAMQPTSHTATLISSISPAHLLLTHCMLMMSGHCYVPLEHNAVVVVLLFLGEAQDQLVEPECANPRVGSLIHGSS